MKDIEYLGAGLKILGLYCVLKSLPIFSNAFITNMGRDLYAIEPLDPLLNTLAYVPGIIYLVAAIILIKFPISVAKLFIPRSASENTRLSFEKNNFLFCSIVILGIYILSWAIPDLVHNLSLLYQVDQFKDVDEYRYKETVAYVVTTLFEISIGIYLVFGSKGIVKVINKIRQ